MIEDIPKKIIEAIQFLKDQMTIICNYCIFCNNYKSDEPCNTCGFGAQTNINFERI